jgi:hypothetical protein
VSIRGVEGELLDKAFANYFRTLKFQL